MYDGIHISPALYLCLSLSENRECTASGLGADEALILLLIKNNYQMFAPCCTLLITIVGGVGGVPCHQGIYTVEDPKLARPLYSSSLYTGSQLWNLFTFSFNEMEYTLKTIDRIILSC